MRGMAWDASRDAELLRLLEAGYSARAAAVEMRLTANAVIGRAHRLAAKSSDAAKIVTTWAQRPGGGHEPASRQRRDPRQPEAPKPRHVPQFVRLPKGPELDALGEIGRQEVARAMRSTAFLPPPDRPPVALEDLGDGCKWPLGDPHQPTFGFCGASRDGKGPYCPRHHAIAYTAAPARPPAPVDVRGMPSRGDRQFMRSLG